jgi:rhodanese-related sulfurtransferase
MVQKTLRTALYISHSSLEAKMEKRSFDQWLTELDLAYWGTMQHKITPEDFFAMMKEKDAVLLDVRTPEEAALLTLPFATQIPMMELPQRWEEIPTDRPVATFCSAGIRATIAFAYLQMKGLMNVRVLAGGYPELTSELMATKVFDRR